MSLPSSYQDFIHLSRYSRWLENENRRETWEETVDRYFNFFEKHLKDNHNYVEDKEVVEELRSAVLNLEVMPSMRALMTAGTALERENVAGYNCSFVAMNNLKSFDEILYVLMCGTGVGFSVERDFVNKLPTLAEEFSESHTTIVVQDSKLGWAKAYRELVSLLVNGLVGQKHTVNSSRYSLTVKFQNGTCQKLDLLEQDLRRSAVERLDQSPLRTYSDSRWILSVKPQVANLIQSKSTISSVKLLKL